MPTKAPILLALAVATLLVWEPFKSETTEVDLTHYLSSTHSDLDSIPLEVRRMCAKQGGCFVVPALSFHDSMKAAYRAGAEDCSKGSTK